MKKRKLKAQIEQALPWIILAAAALVVFFIILGIQRGTGTSLIDKVKNILFGR